MIKLQHETVFENTHHKIHVLAPQRHHCPVCERNFTRRDTLKTHMTKVHQLQIADFNIKIDPASNPKLQASTPAKYLPPFEANPKINHTRRSQINYFEPVLKEFTFKPDLYHCTQEEIPSGLRPRSPPTPVQDEPLPPVMKSMKKDNGIFTIQLKRSHLIPKARFCTQTLPKTPRYIHQIRKRQQIPTTNHHRERLINTKIPGEKILRFDSTTKNIEMITQLQYQETEGPPECFLAPDDPNIASITPLKDSQLATLYADLQLSSDED